MQWILTIWLIVVMGGGKPTNENDENIILMTKSYSNNLAIYDNYITINVCRVNGHNTSFDLHNNSAEVEAILLGYDPRSIHRLNRNKPQQHTAKAMNGNNLAPASMRSIVGCDRSMGKYADSKVVAMAKKCEKYGY